MSGYIGKGRAVAAVSSVGLGDSEKIQLGNDNDLQIYHDGSSSNIFEVGTGNLTIAGTSINFNNNDLGGRYAEFISGGAAKLFHNAGEKLATTSTGIDVTGSVTANSLRVRDDTALTNTTVDSLVLEHYTSATDIDSGFGSSIKFMGENPGHGASVWGRIAGVREGDEATSNPGGGALVFSTDGYSGGDTERLRIDSSGNVGIGATSMNRLLQIQTATTTGLAHLEFRNTQAGSQIGMPANTNALSLYTGDNERMRISSTGNVGFGTSNPQSRIDVGGGYMANEQGRTDHVANTMPSPHYHFDGDNSNDYISTGSNGIGNLGSSSTFSCWVYRDSLNAGYVWDPRSASDNGTGYFYFTSNSNVFSVSTGTVYINGVLSTSPTVDVGAWAHIAVTGATINNPAESYIGRRNSEVYKLHGSIKDFRVYNTALTADEVKELYSGASVPFKYKGASQTSVWDSGADVFTSGTYSWTAYNSNTVTNVSNQLVITYVDNAGGAYIYFKDTHDLASDLTVGKRYRFSCDAKRTGGTSSMLLRLHHVTGNAYSNSNLTTSMIRHNIEFIAGSANGCWVRVEGMSSGGTATIDNISLTQIGAVAEYDGSSATTSTWYDKSGNGLDGTVTGATLQNKVKALEVGGKLVVKGSDKRLRFDNDTTLQSGIEWYRGNTKKAEITWAESDANWNFKHFRADANDLYANIDFYTGSTSSPTRALRIHSNGNITQKAQNVTNFTVSKSFTATGGSVTRHYIDLVDLIGAPTGGTLSYTVKCAGYGGAGSNGITATYTVGGYCGHNYAATNHGSFGAGTIQNGYSSSTGTEYDARGISYHPCKNLGAYMANGEVYAYVPGAQKYGFAISNNHSTSMGIVITVTGSYQ